jgi:TatA/E family protein of Tat protein translocase
MAFLAGSPGPGEIIVIFLLILVLFGPRRLPEIAKMIGKTLHELRRASEDFKDQVMAIETDPVESSDIAAAQDSDDHEDAGELVYSSDEADQIDWSDGADPYADEVDDDMQGFGDSDVADAVISEDTQSGESQDDTLDIIAAAERVTGDEKSGDQAS